MSYKPGVLLDAFIVGTTWVHWHKGDGIKSESQSAPPKAINSDCQLNFNIKVTHVVKNKITTSAALTLNARWNASRCDKGMQSMVVLSNVPKMCIQYIPLIPCHKVQSKVQNEKIHWNSLTAIARVLGNRVVASKYKRWSTIARCLGSVGYRSPPDARLLAK